MEAFPRPSDLDGRGLDQARLIQSPGKDGVVPRRSHCGRGSCSTTPGTDATGTARTTGAHAGTSPGPSGWWSGPTAAARAGRWRACAVSWTRRRGGEPVSSGCGACGSGCVDQTGDEALLPAHAGMVPTVGAVGWSEAITDGVTGWGPRCPPYGYILAVVVAPRSRRCGVGRVLVEEFVARAGAVGVGWVFAAPDAGLGVEGRVAWLRACGFVPVMIRVRSGRSWGGGRGEVIHHLRLLHHHLRIHHPHLRCNRRKTNRYTRPHLHRFVRSFLPPESTGRATGRHKRRSAQGP